MDDHAAQLRSCMYQYSRAIYRSIKDLIDPYADKTTQLEYRRAVLCECEQTMERLAADPHHLARAHRAPFPTAASPAATRRRARARLANARRSPDGTTARPTNTSSTPPQPPDESGR